MLKYYKRVSAVFVCLIFVFISASFQDIRMTQSGVQDVKHLSLKSNDNDGINWEPVFLSPKDYMSQITFVTGDVNKRSGDENDMTKTIREAAGITKSPTQDTIKCTKKRNTPYISPSGYSDFTSGAKASMIAKGKQSKMLKKNKVEVVPGVCGISIFLDNSSLMKPDNYFKKLYADIYIDGKLEISNIYYGNISADKSSNCVVVMPKIYKVGDYIWLTPQTIKVIGYCDNEEFTMSEFKVNEQGLLE